MILRYRMNCPYLTGFGCPFERLFIKMELKGLWFLKTKGDEDRIAMKAPSREIEMTHNVLCCKDVFQNAIRKARADAKADQARVVRDTVNKSTIWSSEVHLNSSNVFVEAFFCQLRLIGKGAESRVCLRRRHFLFERFLPSSHIRLVS